MQCTHAKTHTGTHILNLSLKLICLHRQSDTYAISNFLYLSFSHTHTHTHTHTQTHTNTHTYTKTYVYTYTPKETFTN